MNEDLRVKLMAFFAVNASSVPVRANVPCGNHFGSMAEVEARFSFPIMSVEDWRATYAKKQMEAFESMLEALK